MFFCLIRIQTVSKFKSFHNFEYKNFLKLRTATANLSKIVVYRFTNLRAGFSVGITSFCIGKTLPGIKGEESP